MARLDIYTEQEPYLSVPLRGDRILIGRAEDCAIRIPASTISRHHAVLHRRAGGYDIEDLSRNGTRVNASKIRGRVPLSPGNRIYMGDRIFVYQPDGAPVLLLEPGEAVTETAVAPVVPDPDPESDSD